MKVKFKKNYIDVDQNDIVRQWIAMFLCMILVILTVSLSYAETYVETTSNVNRMEHENESSSEFEIKPIDFDPSQIQFVEEGPEIRNSKIVELTARTTVMDSGYSLASMQIGTALEDTLNIELNEEVEPEIVDEEIVDITEEEPEESLEVETISVEEETVEEPISEPEPVKEYYLNLSVNEKEILCQIVEAEVTGTGSSFGTSDDVVRMCKFRVARVVINRVLSPNFPNSVEGVVFQKNQFSPLIDGRYYKVKVTDLTREAVEMALDKSVPDDIPGALFFTSGKGFSSRRLSYIKTDEVGHKFYK